MSVLFYLERVLLPVTPGKLVVEHPNQNRTAVLMNGEQVNILKQAGLARYRFEALLPARRYPFAVYEGGFRPPEVYLAHLAALKARKRAFVFIVSCLEGGRVANWVNRRVSLEEYTVVYDRENAGEDVLVQLELRDWADFGTKRVRMKKK